MRSPSSSRSLLEVFAGLRAILHRHAGQFTVAEDSATRYCLEGGMHPTHNKPMPLMWVVVGKRYVSFHHMGVYASPALMKSASTRLRARMQGKACFNFTAVDTALFAELGALTTAALTVFKMPPFSR